METHGCLCLDIGVNITTRSTQILLLLIDLALGNQEHNVQIRNNFHSSSLILKLIVICYVFLYSQSVKLKEDYYKVRSIMLKRYLYIAVQ